MLPLPYLLPTSYCVWSSVLKLCKCNHKYQYDFCLPSSTVWLAVCLLCIVIRKRPGYIPVWFFLYCCGLLKHVDFDTTLKGTCHAHHVYSTVLDIWHLGIPFGKIKSPVRFLYSIFKIETENLRQVSNYLKKVMFRFSFTILYGYIIEHWVFSYVWPSEY
jgi:hypothetical protein